MNEILLNVGLCQDVTYIIKMYIGPIFPISSIKPYVYSFNGSSCCFCGYDSFCEKKLYFKYVETFVYLEFIKINPYDAQLHKQCCHGFSSSIGLSDDQQKDWPRVQLIYNKLATNIRN